LKIEWEARGPQRLDNSRPSALQTLDPISEFSVLAGLRGFSDGSIVGEGELREVHARSQSSVLLLQLCHAFLQVSELGLAFVTRVLSRNPIAVSPSLSAQFGGKVGPSPFTWRLYDGRVILGRCWTKRGRRGFGGRR
jgi:hypothetical protein